MHLEGNLRITFTLIFLSLLVIIMASTACSSKPSIGSIIEFGGRQWRALEVKDKKALIISEQILERKPYHTGRNSVTWEKCSLREYLNNEYYNTRFTSEEKACIVETRNSNPPNPWYDTDGGAETIDKIFLLSLDEVVRYFGDSGDLLNKKKQEIDWDKSTIDEDKGIYNIISFDSPDGYQLSDKYNMARITKDADGKERVWWLRSPSGWTDRAVAVYGDGGLAVLGIYFGLDGGVRPAMWIKI